MGVLLQTAVEIPSVDWGGLTPLLIMSGGSLIFLTIWSLLSDRLPSRTPSVFTSLIGVATMVAAAIQWGRINDDHPQGFSTLAGAFGIDGFSLLLTGLIGSAVALTAFYAHDYLEREDINSAEFFVLLMLSASGGIVMAGANDLIVLFLGLEALSIAVYILAASHLRRVESQEAGLKYFILGAFASAFLLYGIALMYGATGSTNLAHIRDSVVALEDRGLAFGAMALLLVGLGFKVAAVPFHSWTPDVYHGAPSPVVSYMASAVKVAGFAGLLRVFNVSLAGLAEDWTPMFFVLACLSMVIGAVVGIVQDNVKRMLAYSSISHAGFILVGAEAASTEGMSAALYYLTAYTFIAVGSFAVIAVVARRGDAATGLEDFRGLAKSQPALALGFTILLLAQAGVPFTTGFLAKFFVIGAAIETEAYVLGVIAMVSAVVGAFLYLRIVLAMYGDAQGETEDVHVPITAAIVVGITVVFTVFFGIFADPLIDLVRDASPVLVGR